MYPDPERPKPPAYTVEFLAKVLLKERLVTLQQAKDVVRRQEALRLRVRKEHMGKAEEKGFRYHVSPAEVFAQAGLETPAGSPLTEDTIMRALAVETEYKYIKLDPLSLDQRLITKTLNKPFAVRYVCLPLEQQEDGKIIFAVDNPFDLDLLESLHSLAPAGFALWISSKTDILRLLGEVYGFRDAVQAAEQNIDTGVDLGNLEQFVQLKDDQDLEATDQHIVRAVDYLLRYAFEQKASDIHIEPKRESANVRLRIDGVLHLVYRLPRVVHQAMTSRLKMLGRMDIAERRRPQDGRIKTGWGQQEVELRMSTLPVAFGEKVVVRIFNPQALFQEPDKLGFSEAGLELYNRFIQNKTGMILVTGPTGSGKTTTLYSTLRRLASPEVNITTIEDPIEMVYEDFNQTMVQTKIGITFASALRTVLRQDPDIIMVGEIRDPETAHMAVQAALTGHLVLSTLHTNDAPGAVTRLQDLGVPNFLIASTVIGVIAQRLIRKVCAQCGEQRELSEEEASALGIHLGVGEGALHVWEGVGCPHCRNVGVSGRVGVFEVLAVDRRIRKLINQGADTKAIRQEAKANGMPTFHEDAVQKLAQGVTCFSEVAGLLGEQDNHE